MSQLIKIPDPGKGLFTAVDQGDLEQGFASELENFFFDRPGKIRKRDGAAAVGSNFPASYDFQGFFRFVHNNLADGATWIALMRKSGVDTAIYGSNGAGSYWFLIENLGSPSTKPSYMYPVIINDVVRLGFRYDVAPRWYGYIKRKFFQDLWDHSWTTPVWFMDTTTPRLPSTWTYLSLAAWGAQAFMVAGFGSLKNGYYFYKATPLFDGNQGALMGDAKVSFHMNIDADSGVYESLGLLLKMEFDSDDWNPRITHISLYRQYNEAGPQDDDAVYQLIAIIPIANDSTSRITATGDRMDSMWYDAERPWGSAALEFNCVHDGAPHTISAPADGDTVYSLQIDDQPDLNFLISQVNGSDSDLIDLYGSLPALFPLYDETYNITQVTRVDGAWDHDNATEICTGTMGSGGLTSYYISSADYGHNAYQNYIIYVAANYFTLVSNSKRTVGMSGGSTSGTGVALLFGPYLWTYSATVATLYFPDMGLLEKGYHPLAGRTSIEAYYKFPVFHKGRLFALNGAWDPSGDNEIHRGWLFYSEIDKPDVITGWIAPDTKKGGDGMGLFLLPDIEALVIFRRHELILLHVPRADPKAWDKGKVSASIGAVSEEAIVETPMGVMFCSDLGVYLLDPGGNLVGPVSFPIADVYEAAIDAGDGQYFSAVYYADRQLIEFTFGNTDTTLWALDLKSLRREIPRWFKATLGTVSGDQVRMKLGALDENGILHFHGYQDTKFWKIGNQVTGAESFGTRFKTTFIRVGSMVRDTLYRYARVLHKGSDAIDPTVYLNEGESSTALTQIAADANGNRSLVSIKQRGRSAALGLVTAASTNYDHEISEIELEVESG